MNNLLNMDQAAEKLGIKKSTLYKMVCEKRIHVIKICGGKNLFDPVKLEKWIADHTQEPIRIK